MEYRGTALLSMSYCPFPGAVSACDPPGIASCFYCPFPGAVSACDPPGIVSCSYCPFPGAVSARDPPGIASCCSCPVPGAVSACDPPGFASLGCGIPVDPSSARSGIALSVTAGLSPCDGPVAQNAFKNYSFRVDGEFRNIVVPSNLSFASSHLIVFKSFRALTWPRY